jgi:hypothetical protein
VHPQAPYRQIRVGTIVLTCVGAIVVCVLIRATSSECAIVRINAEVGSVFEA